LNKKEDYHVHCNYNDHSAADLNVHNAIKHAEQIGLEKIAFTEHVRKSSDWINRYLEEVESAKTHLKVISGFEAKILPDGSIDCPRDYAERYFLVASFHTTFANKALWINALKKAIENPLVDVIGHLSSESSFVLTPKEVDEIASLLATHKKIIELNAKYHRPPLDWLQIFKTNGVMFHLGSDAHALQEIGRFESISDLISAVEDGEHISNNTSCL
jgi:histidinol phosphatase-like PHP family hydrolase